MKFKPRGPNVLVKLDDPKTVSAGGILLLNNSEQTQPKTATILALGTERYDHGVAIPFDVKVGDRVYFNQFGGHEIEVDGQKFRVVRIDDIFGIVE